MKYIGRYRLDAVQGVGAFATVWRGWDEELRVPVAVKVLADNWAHHPDVRERFLDEARILRRIVDPRVVRVHDIGVDDDRPYFVMDFIADGTVADLIGTVGSERGVVVAEEAARAVQVLHDHDVLHRDIKPSNLLVDGHRVLVSDLGSAKRLAEASGITVTTGTPAYMSPEQIHGHALDARSDVYSLGVLAYELITGTVPFEGTNRRAAPPARAGARMDKILAEALATKPSDRPATAAEFADALRTAAAPIVPVRVDVAWVLVLMLVGFLVAGIAAWLVHG